MKDMILTDADTESFQQELFEAIYSVSECKNMKQPDNDPETAASMKQLSSQIRGQKTHELYCI